MLTASYSNSCQTNKYANIKYVHTLKSLCIPKQRKHIKQDPGFVLLISIISVHKHLRTRKNHLLNSKTR